MTALVGANACEAAMRPMARNARRAVGVGNSPTMVARQDDARRNWIAARARVKGIASLKPTDNTCLDEDFDYSIDGHGRKVAPIGLQLFPHLIGANGSVRSVESISVRDEGNLVRIGANFRFGQPSPSYK